MELHRIYNRAQIDDRLVNELVGMCHGILADGVIEQGEAEYLLRWLNANRGVTDNPLVSCLYRRIADMLADNRLDLEEQRELLESVLAFTGGAKMPDGLNYATTLPLTRPEPALDLAGRYCFTGTFAYGTRTDCELAVTERGGEAGSLTKSTDYLVIGIYATDSWAHSSYGRKIEKAVDLRNAGHRISIIAEQHWVRAL